MTYQSLSFTVRQYTIDVIHISLNCYRALSLTNMDSILRSLHWLRVQRGIVFKTAVLYIAYNLYKNVDVPVEKCRSSSVAVAVDWWIHLQCVQTSVTRISAVPLTHVYTVCNSLSSSAGLWHRHCHRDYDAEGAYERWLQNILHSSNQSLTSKLSIFALKGKMCWISKSARGRGYKKCKIWPWLSSFDPRRL